jgi:tRNA (guanine10-N2)-dimethyltransferase
MEYFVILKGHNKDLAIAELETLWETYFNEKITLQNIQNTLYKFNTKNKIKSTHELFKRITYTNLFCEKIYIAKNFEDFKHNAKNLNLQQYNNQKFLVRIRKTKKDFKVELTEKDLSKIIWQQIPNPKVSISNPDVEFDFLFKDKSKEFVITKKIFENTKDYLNRMPVKRPISMPYTLKSDMSRCAINLLGIKKGKILDPFCGIGGILLEACDMGFEIIANDISWNDLKYFKANFEYYFKEEVPTRILTDAQKQFLKDNTIDGIVTDIPYGRCCRRLGDDLYENFLKNASKYLKKDKKLVIIYANFVDFKDLALKYFNEVIEVEEYINRSMTRKILVLENNMKLK